MIYVFGILCSSNMVLLAWALLQRKLVRDMSAQLNASDRRYRELQEQMVELMTPTIRMRPITMYSILGGKS